jgi:hypothetical protein
MIMITYPKTIPMSGAKTMKSKIFRRPGRMRAWNPDLATAEPTKPPTREWETLIGKPM